MAYRIVGDSCLDLTKDLKGRENVSIVSLSLTVDGYTVVDDDTFDQKDFIERVAKSPTCPKSSCPSPEDYMNAFGLDNVDAYGVTLSAELSGSYNSAELGKRTLLEDFPEKNIHIFNSRSASVGETLITMKIVECAESGMAFNEVVDTVEAYIAEQNTMFVLENLETLRKNGRLSNLKAALVSVLNIKPVMVATPEGEIAQLDMGRGIKKALIKMAERVSEYAVNTQNKIFAIAHCNCYERALFFKDEILKRYKFKDIIIVDTAGVSTMYANDGGIIIAF